MFGITEGIQEGLKHRKCPSCSNELSVIFGGLFGEHYNEVKKLGIKHESGCCFADEYYYCDSCHTKKKKKRTKCK